MPKIIVVGESFVILLLHMNFNFSLDVVLFSSHKLERMYLLKLRTVILVQNIKFFSNSGDPCLKPVDQHRE
jgi:hypothetical protein